MTLDTSRRAWLVVVAAFGAPLASLAAQDLAPPETVVVHPDKGVGLNLAVPQPPRAILENAPQGRLPPIPVADHGLPQPDSPPCVIGDLQRQPAAGQFTFFRNRDHRPAGAGILHPGEPSAAANRDTYFATGNTYGSLSRDSGMTWSHVNPYTLFPAVDGGACCDQRVIVDNLGHVFWYIQYRYSATTGAGGFRLAVSNNRTNLRNAVWSSYYFTAASFGLPGNWLDFPDIAVSGSNVYIATNVFNASSVYQNALVIRMPISQLTGGGTVVASYYRSSGGTAPMGGNSYRLTQTFAGSPSATMYWASHLSTSSIRIFAWADASGGRAADVDRSIPAWTGGAGTSPGPDGRDWIGFDDHRIASGYISPVYAEGAFLWSSNANGGTRPQNYVRAQAFRPSDRAIIVAEDLWSPAIDFAYPAVGMNSLGHGGVVVSGGSSAIHVTTYFFLVDNYYSSFAGATLFPVATGSNGAPSNRWGDYHSVVANPIEPRTFIGTGMHMSGGTATANTVHRTAWFGRDDYTPAWVPLNVASTPISGVSITVDETDVNGNKNGLTPFARSFTPQQGFTVRAPASVTSAGNTYLFANWTGTGGVNLANPVLVWANIGTSAVSVSANYALQTTITVDDRNVTAGVPITVGTIDLDGRGDGTTQFSRRYRASDGPFAFTAPTLAGAQPFYRWHIAGLPQPVGQRTISFTPTAGVVTIEAEYCSYTAGAYTAYGAGCSGSNAQTPLHASTSVPDIGRTVTHTVARLAGPTPAVMALGTSNTTWNGLPLPLSLGFLGANPACNLLAEPLVLLPVTIDAAGNGSVSFPLANDPNTIGARLFTQVIAVDVFVSFPTKLVVSNGLQMLIGGSSRGGQVCP